MGAVLDGGDVIGVAGIAAPWRNGIVCVTPADLKTGGGGTYQFVSIILTIRNADTIPSDGPYNIDVEWDGQAILRAQLPYGQRLQPRDIVMTEIQLRPGAGLFPTKFYDPATHLLTISVGDLAAAGNTVEFGSVTVATCGFQTGLCGCGPELAAGDGLTVGRSFLRWGQQGCLTPADVTVSSGTRTTQPLQCASFNRKT